MNELIQSHLSPDEFTEHDKKMAEINSEISGITENEAALGKSAAGEFRVDVQPDQAITPNPELSNDPEKARRDWVAKIVGLVEKINESEESLPFPGIRPDAYLKMKATDEEFPGYTTPIDELIQRCEERGIKIVAGEDPGLVFVLPADSDDTGMDGIAPHQLEIGNVANVYLAELIPLTAKKTK